MKFFFTLSLIISSLAIFSQQNLPIPSRPNEKKPVIADKHLFTIVLQGKDIKALDEKDQKRLNELTTEIAKKIVEQEKENEVKHFSVFGIGNISDETLEKLNGGGKLAVGFCPKLADLSRGEGDKQKNFFVSFNKNATNKDSLFASTLLFPEVGNHSLLITAFDQKFKQANNGLVRFAGFFGEFALKEIKTDKDSAKGRNETLSLNTLHYTAGYRFGYSKTKTEDGTKNTLGINTAIFISYVNIPDEDDESFRKLINVTGKNNDFWAAGIKFTIDIKGFQLFADLRHVFGSEKNLPLKELKGFNSNLGIAFNTQVFAF